MAVGKAALVSLGLLAAGAGGYGAARYTAADPAPVVDPLAARVASLETRLNGMSGADPAPALANLAGQVDSVRQSVAALQNQPVPVPPTPAPSVAEFASLSATVAILKGTTATENELSAFAVSARSRLDALEKAAFPPAPATVTTATTPQYIDVIYTTRGR